MTNEDIALEDRASKPLPLGRDVHAPSLVAIRDALRTAAFRERPVPRAQPQDGHMPPPVFPSPRPIGFLGSDDPGLASYLRIEERELEAGGLN